MVVRESTVDRSKGTDDEWLPRARRAQASAANRRSLLEQCRLAWQTVADEQSLFDWETSWWQTALLNKDRPAARLFPSDLLRKIRYYVYGRSQEWQLTAGAVPPISWVAGSDSADALRPQMPPGHRRDVNHLWHHTLGGGLHDNT
jgi:hypothetical protein